MACSMVLVDPFDSLDSNPVQHMQLSKGEIMTGEGVRKRANKKCTSCPIFTRSQAHTLPSTVKTDAG